MFCKKPILRTYFGLLVLLSFGLAGCDFQATLSTNHDNQDY